MFESDDVSAFLKRNTSAPTENSDTLLPKYSYEDNQLDMNSMYYNNGSARGNDGVDLSNLLDENATGLGSLEDGASAKSLISSLMADSSRTMDLIQADFPSTPSSFFSSQSSRLIVASSEVPLELDKIDVGLNEDHMLATLAAQGNQPQQVPQQQQQVQQQQQLDLSMQQLYLSEDDAAAAERARAGSGLGVPPNSAATTKSGVAGMGGQAPLTSAPAYPEGQNGQMQYRGQNVMPQMMSPIQYVAVDHTGAPIPGNQMQQGQGGPVQAYYVQQPMYVDQNGQPIYYRMGPGGQYQQEVMYATGPDGNPVTDPMMSYMPYGANGMGQQGQQPYWPGGAPSTDANGNPVYVGPNGQPMMPDRRMAYGNQQQGYMMGGPGGSRGMNNGGGAYGGLAVHGDPMEQLYGGSSTVREPRQMDRNKERREYNRDGDKFRNDRNGGRGNAAGGVGGRNSVDYGRNSNGSVNPLRDPLVDEFRATYGKSRQWELIDLIGHVVAFCQDQHGSRFIQQRLEVCTEVDKQLIFDEIVPSAHGLMTDVFGNYVLQKLFEYGTPDQCESLALLLTGQAVQLSMQMYGCRVVQKALEYVNTQRLIALVTEFENPQVLLRCVHDSNGNHVIQKCIEIVSRVAKEAATPELSDYLSSRIMFIINSFQGRVKELSSHPYGCRVVQRILEHCSNPQKAVILEELRKCCSELVQDCYGNYVIQFVMQHGWEADRAVLIKEVQGHLLDFSQHKFASNVVEKCLQYASKRDRDEMIWTIINVTFDLNSPVDAKTGHCVLESMVRDPYANYVVQKVIDVSDERQRAAIMRYVRENIVQLRRYTYGKHIIVRLEKITNEKF